MQHSPRFDSGREPRELLELSKTPPVPPNEADPAWVGRMLGDLFEALGPLLSASFFCMDRCEQKIVYTSRHLLAAMGHEPRDIAYEDLHHLVHPRDRHLIA